MRSVPPPSDSPEGLPSLRGRVRKPSVIGPWLAVAVMVVGFFLMLWAFGGFLAKNSGMPQSPGLVEITVDGAPLTTNTHPDIVAGTIDVPAGATIDITCEASMSRALPTFRLHAGRVHQEAPRCRFTTTAPPVAGESEELTIEVIDTDADKTTRTQKFTLHAVDPKDQYAVTHVVPADADVDSPDSARLQVAHRSKVVGKLFAMKTPERLESLRALVFVGKLGEEKRLQLAVDMDALSRGKLVPIATPLARYRAFGQAGVGLVFETKQPVWIGDAADSTQVFQIASIVVDESAVAGIVADHMSTTTTTDGRIRLAVKGYDTDDLRRISAAGWVSDDLRLIRAPATAKGLPEVTWGSVTPERAP